MKVAIVGSRTIHDANILELAIKESKFDIIMVISGGAIGVDTLAEQWAARNNMATLIFRPRWDMYGKKAGFIRNERIAREADACIAIWDGTSKGTESTIDLFNKLNKPIYVVTCEPNNEIKRYRQGRSF